MPDGSVSITRASVDYDEVKALIREAVSEVAKSSGGALPICFDVFASSFRDALVGGRSLARLERECGREAVVVALVAAAHGSVGGRARFVESEDHATVALSFALEAWARDTVRGHTPARDLCDGIESIASAPSESDDELARDLLLLATFVIDGSAKVSTEVRGREAVRFMVAEEKWRRHALVTQHCDSDEDDASVAALRALESAIDHARTWRESNARQEGRPAA